MIRFFLSPHALVLALGALPLVAACSSSSAEATTHDAGHGADTGSEKADTGTKKDAGAPVTKRVFVTSGKFTGDFATQGGASDGLSGGDAVCNMAAQTAGLTGTWVAWLSTSETNAASRVDLTAIRVLVDGTTKIFDPAGSDGLVSLNPLTMTENGDTLPTSGDGDGFEVWTGTDGNGHYETESTEGTSASTDDACKGWTSSSSSLAAVEGSLGAVASSVVPDSNWTDGSPDGLDTCDVGDRLYCFEK